MQVAQFVEFWTRHNDLIIQLLVFTILSLAAFLLFRMIFSGGDKAEVTQGPALATPELETTLKKILEQVPQAPAENQGPLKESLEAKEKELNELREKMKTQEKDVDPSKYLIKISELEGKLAEYEILEDDIADLSLYKEENTRLKLELSKFKGEVESAPGDFPADLPSEEEASATNVVDQAVDSNNEDFVAEFKAAVQPAAPPAEHPAEQPTEQPVAQPVNPAPAAAPEPKPTVAQDMGDDDILAEFANASTSEDSTGVDMDTDKMLAELETLSQQKG